MRISSGDEGFLHKRQLARRLRGFQLISPPLAYRQAGNTFEEATHNVVKLQLQTKLKYVMQIFKSLTTEKTFLFQMEKSLCYFIARN